jgi:hypothetical protein
MSWGAMRYQPRVRRKLPTSFKRYPKRNYHHLQAFCRGGQETTDNLLLIDKEKHENWHKVFGNRTLDEIISLLTRLRRMKERLKEAA